MCKPVVNIHFSHGLSLSVDAYDSERCQIILWCLAVEVWEFVAIQFFICYCSSASSLYDWPRSPIHGRWSYVLLIHCIPWKLFDILTSCDYCIHFYSWRWDSELPITDLLYHGQTSFLCRHRVALPNRWGLCWLRQQLVWNQENQMWTGLTWAVEGAWKCIAAWTSLDKIYFIPTYIYIHDLYAKGTYLL